jgi:4-hydroxybenzoate polyprenyltransferase
MLRASSSIGYTPVMRDGGVVSSSIMPERIEAGGSSVSGVAAGFRIVWGVVSYRILNLEMANLAAAGSIAVSLHLHWLDIGVRTLFAFMLNVLVYLNNDYIDVAVDLQSSDKDNQKARFLHQHIRAGFWAQIVLLLGLAAMAVVYDIGLLVPLIAGGGVCWWYSWQLKRCPYLDIVAMMIWGITMPLVGSPLLSVLGWCMALQLGLFSGVFESIQVVRDADEDSKEGVRTTAVVLGKGRTLLLAKAIMVIVSVYAALVLHPIAALITLAALVVPFIPDNVEKYWTRVKLVYGIAWLFICAWVFFKGQSSGLLWAIERTASLG